MLVDRVWALAQRFIISTWRWELGGRSRGEATSLEEKEETGEGLQPQDPMIEK